MSINVKKLGKSIIYKAVQPVISKSVLPNATRQDDAYKEREIQAAMAVNKLTTSIRKRGAQPFRPTTQDVKRIESTPEWKKLHRSMESGQRQKSMNELMGDQTFTNHPERDATPTPASKVSSAKYDANGSVIPQSGQWYFILAQDYYILWEDNKTYFVSRDDFPAIKHFCTHISRDAIGNKVMTPLSLGRFSDVLNSQPSLDDLKTAQYKFERLTLAELNEFGETDIENAIPLFGKD